MAGDRRGSSRPNHRRFEQETEYPRSLCDRCPVFNMLGQQYALIWLPNVKVMDLIVFVSGLRFGAYVGGIVGVLVWAIYCSINPYGFAMPIRPGCMASESLFGIA